MTKEELLIKRVIVQHLYPNSCFKINDILTLETDPHDKTYKAYGKIGRFYISEKEVNDSIESGSNDFLLLEWWEYRVLKANQRHHHLLQIVKVAVIANHHLPNQNPKVNLNRNQKVKNLKKKNKRNKRKKKNNKKRKRKEKNKML